MRSPAVRAALVTLGVLAHALPVCAQPEPPVGVRAAGMAGAFTAVADDASAVVWNPAGLASGSFFSLVLDHNSVDQGSGTLLALGTPPLGLSYYRTSLEAGSDPRRSLTLHHAGVTVLQSLTERFVVGGTLKLVHGDVSTGGASISTNRFDTDLGFVAKGSLGRIGLSVRNLTAPEFDTPEGGTARLDRRVRAGVAVNISARSLVAADFDLTTADTPRGEWREAAIGGEANPVKLVWVRGGVRWNTADGPSAPVGSVGASVAVYGSTLADVQVSFGSEDGNRGWGAGLRFVF